MYAVHIVDTASNTVKFTNYIPLKSGWSICMTLPKLREFKDAMEIRICYYNDKCDHCWQLEEYQNEKDEGYETTEYE